jgi:hypothetical protein
MGRFDHRPIQRLEGGQRPRLAGMREYFQSVERDLFGTEPRPSIPIKPITFKATALSPARSGSRDVTPREATALLIAAKVTGCSLEPGRAVPRSFGLWGSEWIIENGCGQDIARSGLADIAPGSSPREDRFILTARFIQWVETAVGPERVKAFMASPLPTQLTPA